MDAADGYRAVFALPRLDHAFTKRVILLADRRDGKALSVMEGPLRVVVIDEKRQGRWVRQVISLSIRRARESKFPKYIIARFYRYITECMRLCAFHYGSAKEPFLNTCSVI